MTYVPGRGPLHAEIVVVGEAPGRREVEQGLPFVGPSGKLQDKWIMDAGLHPGTIRYENVFPYFPPGGEIWRVGAEELAQWQDDLLVRLDECPGVRVIVPTGNTALGTLLGLSPQKAQITQRRGSIYLWQQASGRRVKVIPVIHPAAVLRQEGEQTNEGKKNYEARCRADWRKVAREVKTGLEGVPPQRELDVVYDVGTWENCCVNVLLKSEKLAFDIETNPDEGKILCISFAPSPDWAVAVPWSARFMPGIKTLLESPLPKIGQNAQYDCYWLARAGIHVQNWQHDTMAKSCLLWPGEPHSLAYLTSILTNEPWYKGGDEDSGEKAWSPKQPFEQLLGYCARDSAVTWEVNECEDEELLKRGWMHIYKEQYQALFKPVLKTMLHGINTNIVEMETAFHEALATAQQAMQKAQELAGVPLFTFSTQIQEAAYRISIGEWDASDPAIAKKLARSKGDVQKYIEQVQSKGISNAILKTVLYDQMGVPVQRKRGTKKVTVDEAALLKVRARYKDTGRFPKAIQLIEQALLYREHKKQSEFLDPRRIDEDGRFRASYSFRPTTGRLSSSSNPRGTGGNAQNIDRDLRRPFKPDPGCLLLEVDLSQAEARVVYCLTRDKQLIELAHLRPSEFDIHTFMSKQVFGLPMGAHIHDERLRKEAFKRDRYLAKRIVHAGHYDLHGNKCSEILLKDGYDLSPKQCTALQNKYFDFAPGIHEWHQRTRMEVLSFRCMTNAWGRTIQWPYDPFGDELYRRAYAFRPQSDIARHLNRGWIVLDSYLEREGLQSKVNLQLHDALIISVLPEEAWQVTAFLVGALETSHNYYGENLVIPAEVKIGLAWGEGKEFKQLPGREEFEQAVKELCYAIS